MNATNPKHILAALVTGVALLVGIAAIVVPLVANGAKSTTSADNISITHHAPELAAVADDNFANAAVVGALLRASGVSPDNSTSWRVPVSTPFATFPLPDGEWGCGPEQMAWLQKYAKPSVPMYRFLDVELRNDADAGGSLSITNIRADGKLDDESKVVWLQCAGVGGDGSQAIDLRLDGSPGVWAEPYGWEDDPQPVGSLATVNLAPGQLSMLTFIIADNERKFTGRIVGDLVSPSTGVVILVDGLSVDSTPVDGYYLSLMSGALECSKPGQDFFQCTPAVAEEMLREAGRS